VGVAVNTGPTEARILDAATTLLGERGDHGALEPR
jgi:hypothetical protein